MGILSNVIAKITGETFKVGADLIDSVHTSREEKLVLKADLETKLKELELEAERLAESAIASEDVQRTERLRIDMGSDSWLSKNIRPLSLVFLDVTVMILAYGTTFNPKITALQIQALNSWIPLFTALLLTVHAFYFGGRSYEKMKKLKSFDLKQARDSQQLPH